MSSVSSTSPSETSHSPTVKTSTRVRRNEVICVFGRKGSGKSYSIKQRLLGVPESRALWVWDPVSEYAGPAAEVPLPGAQLFGSMMDFLTEAANGRVGKRIVMQAPRHEFDQFCRFAYKAGRVTVVVDEVNLFCSPSKCPEPLLELLRIGRHAEVDLIFAARRPAEVSRDLTAQADRIVAFRTTEPNDLDFFARVCGKWFAETLPNLAQYEPSMWEG